MRPRSEEGSEGLKGWPDPKTLGNPQVNAHLPGAGDSPEIADMGSGRSKLWTNRKMMLTLGKHMFLVRLFKVSLKFL